MSANRDRFAEIIRVLGKYGFGHLYKTRIRPDKNDQDPADLRLAFEELGPSFIKIGQILSTRNDILPSEYIKELQKLQDNTSPLPYNIIEDLIELHLQQPIENLFASFDKIPMASASIAQIHRAQLKNGDQVIVKVQRPNIENELIRDINIFIRVIEYIPTIFLGIMINPIEILQEIKQQTLQEIDFEHEAQNALKFAKLNQDRTVIRVPKPYLDYTSEKVMVQEFIDGSRINQNQLLDSQGYDRSDIAEKLVYAYLYQVFDDGFYHGDPHPGNLLIDDGKIVFIDFGLMGIVTPMNKKFLLDGLKAIVFKDVDQLVSLLLQICKQNRPVDRVEFYRDINYLFDKYLTKGFAGIDIEAIFQDIMRFGHQHGLTFPSDFIILEKTVVMLQGVLEDLDPDLDFMQVFQSFMWSGNLIDWKDYLDPNHLFRAGSRQARTLANIPQKLETTLDQINNDRLSVRIGFENIEDRLTQVNQMINRVISSLILAALIISSTFIVTTASTQSVELLGIIFFIIASIIGLVLLISIFRTNRK
ncbi:ABC1 kinase family protein [Aerococcus kribbianus]|uniref:AarF/UbiB family protein n=1 Tax=Aerococcus kribbianus TaxID=2999064 RepID=A0A9X3FLK5_9LACT|nr:MULTISPECIES: AarF/UbiB family protein [unclassified Aerococcus]MCZ0716715.1 AarF/UbiB family protein [Aerococcus sp. YH-aer221]MCZ0725003.1 AarF/UbiB family protein [Aerococcus sp. YH-aer222]